MKKNSDRAMDRYMREVGTHEILSREREQALARRYRQRGDRAAAEALVVANLRFVVKVAHGYRGYKVRMLDLVQEGNLGLMRAVEKFDPDRGYRLISYAVWWIRAYMQNFIMRSHSLVKLGTTQAQRKLFFKVRSERERADKGMGDGESAPSSIIAKRLAVREREVADMEHRLAASDFSLDAPLYDAAQQTFVERLPDAAEWSVEDLCAEKEEMDILLNQVDEAMRDFNTKERRIVRDRLLARNPQTLARLGRRLGISRERVRQIESNILGKLRQRLSETGLGAAAA